MNDVEMFYDLKIWRFLHSFYLVYFIKKKVGIGYFYIKNLKFVDGYINSNTVENDKLKSMTDVMTIIKSKKCANLLKPNSNGNDMLISIYNLYQLNNFFNNIITIFCTESKGGKRKRKINQRKTKRRRSNKRKSLKRKSLKR